MMVGMIDVTILRNEPAKVRQAVAAKKGDATLVDRFLELDEAWRKATAAVEQLRAEQKQLGEKRDIEGAKALKEKIKSQEEELSRLEGERNGVWAKIPNLPSEDTPIGQSEEDNKVIRKVGEPRKFDFEPKDHVALGEALDLIDSETAGKVTGARFTYIKGDLVRLEFALLQYVLEILSSPAIMKSIAEGVKPGYNPKLFVPVLPPVMIRPEVFDRMARLEPREERYHIPSDDLYLIGSAEHTLGPMHMDEIIPEEQLPLRYVGFSTSFRREAGSYGKDTKGILRVHQFDKIELESFTTPEDSVTEQELFIALQEYFMWSLELPYQVVAICTADMGGPDYRQRDIETWLPGQGKYRETHTSDLMTDYQTRRLNTKVRRADGRTEFVHTNDATAIAMSRTLIAIMENYQTKDGKIEVPKVLQKYVGKEIIG
jgi:seryl-tRNA synthetase